jgi:hypothetical protein
MTDATELLDSFSKELPNEGTWYWQNKKDEKGVLMPGSKARILVPITKMLRAGIDEITIKEIIISLIFTGYVEHERQVKAKTGLSVREFMEKKLETLSPPHKTDLEPVEAEISQTSEMHV